MLSALDRLNPRRTFLLMFAGCTGLMLVAMVFQHAMHLEPCPLCITQRVFVIAIGILSFIAWLQNPSHMGKRIYAGLLVLLAIIGGSVSSRQIWLQNLPVDQQPACGPGLSFMLDTLPFFDVVTLLFKGDGNCAEVQWTFLGLSIPGWTLIAFIGLAGISVWQLIRKK